MVFPFIVKKTCAKEVRFIYLDCRHASKTLTLDSHFDSHETLSDTNLGRFPSWVTFPS